MRQFARQFAGMALVGTRGANVRDVPLAAEEIEQSTVGIVNRAKVQRVPERGAVLAVVEQLNDDHVLIAQGIADARNGGRVGRRALQEAAVAPDDFGLVIAG